MTWACNHTHEQRGGVRCVRCCVRHPGNYELLRAAGGTPWRYRWLCNACLEVYRDLGLLAGESRLIAVRAQSGIFNRKFTKVKRAV